MNKRIVYVLSTLSQLADNVQVTRMEGNNSATVIYLSYSFHSVLLSLYTACGCPACVCLFVLFCHHVHLDPRNNIGAYVFTATRKTLLYIYYNRDFCWKCFVQKLRRYMLASMPLTTPKPQNTDTNGIHTTLLFTISTKNARFVQKLQHIRLLLCAHILNIIT